MSTSPETDTPAVAVSVARKAAVAGAVAAASVAAAGAISSLSAAAYFARRALTPDRERPDDTHILAVDEGSVTLGLTPETVIPGRYGLWLDGGGGHARLGDILDLDEAAGRVRREVHGVDFGQLAPGFARWNQYYFAGPPDRALGVRTTYADVPTELGTMPAWVIPPEQPASRWAIPGPSGRRRSSSRPSAVTSTASVP